MKTSILICTILLLLKYHASAQTSSSIFGTIKDNNEPVLFEPVLLKSSKDSSLFTGVLSDELGAFRFNGLPEGSYYIEIGAGLYEKYISQSITVSGEDVNLGSIALQESSIEMDEIVVTTMRPFMDLKAGVTTINVENSLLQNGFTLLEVLNKLPGVFIDQNGTISLNGKQGVGLSINSKLSRLGGEDLLLFLQSEPSSNVKSIEIIPAPPASMDAAGGKGIINIVLKKNRKPGLSGNATLSYGQGIYPKSISSLNLNYNSKFINLFFNYGYIYRKNTNRLTLDRKIFDNAVQLVQINSKNTFTFPQQSNTPKLGIDINLNKNTLLSIVGNATLTNTTFEGVGKSEISYLTTQEKWSNLFYNTSKETRKNYGLSTQFQHSFDSLGQQLTIDLDYARYNNSSTPDYFSSSVSDGGVLVNEVNWIGSQKGLMDIFVGGLNYAKTIGNISYTCGVKSGYLTNENALEFYRTENGVTSYDSTLSNQFHYNELISAAYINMTTVIKKLNVVGGLRVENTLGSGSQNNSIVQIKRNYTQAFPFLSLNIAHKNGDYTLNFSRRIDRPTYGQLNPFRLQLDANTYAEGNPLLLPQLTNTVAFTYGYKQFLFFSASFDYVTNVILDALIRDSLNQNTLQTVINLKENNNYTVSIAFMKYLKQKWMVSGSFYGLYSVYKGSVNAYTVTNQLPTFGFNLNNNIVINNKGLSGELSFSYSHKMYYGITTVNPMYNLSLGLKQQLWNNRGSIALDLSDVFWKFNYSGLSTYLNVVEDWHNRSDSRILKCTFVYKFGLEKKGKIRNNSVSDEEQRRSI